MSMGGEEEATEKKKMFMGGEEDEAVERKRRLCAAIEADDVEMVEKIVIENRTSIEDIDQNGTTPLQLAAFKGRLAIARVLVEHGAQVNNDRHEHGYTALMFAALSGNVELCQMLLDHDAHPFAVNTSGRNAAELAAFIGEHKCVSAINSHIGMDEVLALLDDDDKKKYPLTFARQIQQLAKTNEIHPVKVFLSFVDVLLGFPFRILFYVRDHIDLIVHRKKLLYVIDRLFERQLRSKEGNEVMSLKLWLILFVLREAFKFLDESKGDDDEPNRLMLFARRLMTIDASCQSLFRSNLETLLRNAIHSFPYHHILLFQTLIKAIAQTKFGDSPSAFSYLNQALFGHRIVMDYQFCSTCGHGPAKKRCTACKSISYCSIECQKFDWFIHKRLCPILLSTKNSSDTSDIIVEGGNEETEGRQSEEERRENEETEKRQSEEERSHVAC